MEQITSEAIIKSVISNIHFYSKESFIDFACSHYANHYSCYVDVSIEYYYIYENVYIIIDPIFKRHNKEFLEIMLAEGFKDCFPVASINIQDSLSGEFVQFLDGDPKEECHIFYNNKNKQISCYYKISRAENGQMVIEEDEEI